MAYKNRLKLRILAKSENEGFCRSVVGAFCIPLNPTLEEINDIKTAVSEAVTNSIVHGYNYEEKEMEIVVDIEDRKVVIEIIDFGVGIDNIDEAMKPFFTTREDEERSGMGFTVMDTFMDDLKVEKNPSGKGIKVILTKYIGGIIE